jgi:hypothetical protein
MLKTIELTFSVGEKQLKICYPKCLPEKLRNELLKEYPEIVTTDFPEEEYQNGRFGIGELKQYIEDVRERIANLAIAFRKKSIESAKTAIMARNGSHNLGSHVMAYLKSELTSVETILEKNVLRELLDGTVLEDISKELHNAKDALSKPETPIGESSLKENSCGQLLDKTVLDGIEKYASNVTKILDGVKSSMKELELPVLVGLGRFITYLQERQDYIATVATNYIPPNGTIAFKDAIYDELNMDWRWERHGNSGANLESLRGRKPENILMKFIALSEGYTKKQKAVLSNPDPKQKNDDTIIIQFGNFDGSSDSKKHAENDFKRLRELEVGIPGSIIGRQAFFSIIENIIRNAAKHSIKEKELRIVMDVLDAKSLEELEKSEELSPEDKKYLPKFKDLSWKYHILSITNKLRNNFSAIENIRAGIRGGYIDGDGRMNDDYKGIKEMRISAAWLRGFNIDDDIPKEEPPALCVLPTDIKKDENGVETCSIQYLLCLPKPQKVVLVLSEESYKTLFETTCPMAKNSSSGRELQGMFEEKMKTFREYGWKILTEKEFFGENANYEMVVAENEDVRGRIEPRAPSRLIIWDDALHNTSNEIHLARIFKGDRNFTTHLFNTTLVDGQEKDSSNGNEKARPVEEKPVTSCVIQKTLGEDIAKILNSSDLPTFKETFTRRQELFYKTWCSRIVTGQNLKPFPKLVIMDDKTTDLKIKEYWKSPRVESKDDKDEDVVIELNDAVSAPPYCGFAGNINFATHYQGGASGDSLWDKRKMALFAESISGADSSERYIRRNTWTLIWYYKTIAASLARVAIFDERLFNDFHPISCPLDSNNGEANFQIVKAQRFYAKRIWFYNFDFPKSGNKVALLGYNLPIGVDLSDFDPTKQKITTLGNITLESDGEIKFNIDKEMKLQNKFDFLVIHQGLLDKIYEFGGIKGMDKEEAKKQKTEFVRGFHQYFSATIKQTSRVIQNSTPPAYLSNLIIHSGRSKPSRKDMPFNQPFLQFAAIENAIKDCKHLLMELLYSTHYENNRRPN